MGGFVVRVSTLSSLVLRCCSDGIPSTTLPRQREWPGAFTTNARKCGEEAVLLRRVLSRLIELDDDDDDDDDDDGLGMLASLNEVADAGTFVVSDTLLPPRANDLESDLGGLRDLEIQEFLIRRRNCRGLTTSAFYATARHAPVDPTSITPITSTSPTPAVEYAMTFAWAEHSLLDDGIALRRKMHAASRADTEGLSLSAGIYRGEFRTLPTFLGDDESFVGIEPRALEVVFIQQCYWPVNTATTTKELAQAVLGVVKGLRNIYKLGYIHRDISYDSVVIDRDGVGALIDYHLAVPHDRPCTEGRRRIRSGTWPYLPCSILAQPQQPLRVVHERWHDIESLFYVVMEISFREPYMGDDEVLVMTPDVYVLKFMLRLNTWYHKLLKGCAQRWTNIKQLVDILRSNCGLDNRFVDVEVAMEEAQLGELWGPSGTMSYEAIISEMERLLPLL
ncbi:BZ3500_MvSof-1268-A1-R1_Chr6-3g08992 [Microbotryum saponariae]|uniref:BZ3500_MvSof-1268-A1-R1_Chr6-3g08992 protein n=1 Tax=Microbotryum saponariae TaxID=289078 RepID=A0A2X0LKG2_9BASI|nr:BZ3500_MvSof-1268-A1-R1_Chr6-3g08992 [Microbotryum saponariae]SDA07594.1 BZ3501_MvSof-1269-A2-R1_Chr6-2g08696 [Microbotryum saponariae]